MPLLVWAPHIALAAGAAVASTCIGRSSGAAACSTGISGAGTSRSSTGIAAAAAARIWLART